MSGPSAGYGLHSWVVYYAHSRQGADLSDWHRLEDHLLAVARLAAHSAGKFESTDWGQLAGLWHDLGKFDARFQQRLHGSNELIDHSVVGAALAISRFRDLGWYLAFPIAGHHAGLADLRGDGPPTPLTTRIAADRPQPTLPSDIPEYLRNRELPPLPEYLRAVGPARGGHMDLVRRTEFWIRYLFSALVDADWLDTEHYFSPHKTLARVGGGGIPALRSRLTNALETKRLALSTGQRTSAINTARAEVLKACNAAADGAPGLFSLTAPTGSGKTLSSMGFALRHAERNGLDRVIVVLPYTSIIEQNAAVYRDALGHGAVVEHHSNFDPGEHTSIDPDTAARHQLATENWDAPVIVTTTVQFFESLFSNRPSQCRKLHNIARSVIILDEVQTLPTGFLLPILDALNELVAHYGCTVMLSTATPPALERRPGFELGLSGVRPVLTDAAALARQLQRVEYHWLGSTEASMDWSNVAERLAEERSCMGVVNLRADARELARRLALLRPSEPIFHLSALMCAAHRAVVLERVRHALAVGEPCRLVSTQLIEAGVDIDFPVVWRALCGLDSVVQAAGRCNREGRNKIGHVYVFRAASTPPAGTLRKGAEITSAMLAESSSLDLCDPAVFDSYFRRLYMVEEPDKHQIQALRQELRFASVGREFRLIEDGWSQPVIVPYGDSPELIEGIRSGPHREALRRVQRYVVQIPMRAHERMLAEGILEEVAPGVFALRSTHSSLYDSRFGLLVDGPPARPRTRSLTRKE
jgi:CRISPR-associated endonuclease/helicase Cas3